AEGDEQDDGRGEDPDVLGARGRGAGRIGDRRAAQVNLQVRVGGGLGGADHPGGVRDGDLVALRVEGDRGEGGGPVRAYLGGTARRVHALDRGDRRQRGDL